jgi:deoxyxylulose-5-phosphate synthase
MVRILDQVKQRLPFEVDLLNHRMVLPIRHDVLDEIFAEYDQIYVYEESVYYGSLAEKLKAVYPEIEVKTLPMAFIKQGLIPDILEAYGLGPNAIVHDLMKRHG